jgi:hypothetical protein
MTKKGCPWGTLFQSVKNVIYLRPAPVPFWTFMVLRIVFPLALLFFTAFWDLAEVFSLFWICCVSPFDLACSLTISPLPLPDSVTLAVWLTVSPWAS